MYNNTPNIFNHFNQISKLHAGMGEHYLPVSCTEEERSTMTKKLKELVGIKDAVKTSVSQSQLDKIKKLRLK